MTFAFKVTRENVDLLEEVAEALSLHLDDIAQKTKRYPVEVEFAGYRFVFASRSDVVDLIQMLRGKTQAYRQHAA